MSFTFLWVINDIMAISAFAGVLGLSLLHKALQASHPFPWGTPLSNTMASPVTNDDKVM